MGVYIPGMALPEKESVGLFLYPDGRVNMWRPHALVGQKYEAVPVPPHGDLIDRNALPTSRVEWEDIVNAPTIIPAEEV